MLVPTRRLETASPQLQSHLFSQTLLAHSIFERQSTRQGIESVLQRQGVASFPR